MRVCGISYPLKQHDNNLLSFNINNKLHLFDTSTRFNINLLNPNLKQNLKDIEDDYLKVQHLPTGCLLVEKDVFFQLVLCADIKSYQENDKTIFNFFDCRVYNNKYLSEDYSFSQYCIDSGINNYCFVKGNIGHIGYFNYKGNLKECIKKYYLLNK